MSKKAKAKPFILEPIKLDLSNFPGFTATIRPPTPKEAAQDLAAANKRLQDAEARHDKAVEELAGAIHELLNAQQAADDAEDAFQAASVKASRKKFGLPEPALENIGVTLSGIQTSCDCPSIFGNGFTFSIPKP